MIVSLAYLAIQIRQNTQQIRQNIEASQVASYNQAQEQTWQSTLAMAQGTEAARSAAKLFDHGSDALAAASIERRLADRERGAQQAVARDRPQRGKRPLVESGIEPSAFRSSHGGAVARS